MRPVDHKRNHQLIYQIQEPNPDHKTTPPKDEPMIQTGKETQNKNRTKARKGRERNKERKVIERK
jgi:hypothetical protein